MRLAARQGWLKHRPRESERIITVNHSNCSEAGAWGIAPVNHSGNQSNSGELPQAPGTRHEASRLAFSDLPIVLCYVANRMDDHSLGSDRE